MFCRKKKREEHRNEEIKKKKGKKENSKMKLTQTVVVNITQLDILSSLFVTSSPDVVLHGSQNTTWGGGQ